MDFTLEHVSKENIGYRYWLNHSLLDVFAFRYTFPRLLDQCAEGWVNNIVFTNSSSTKVRKDRKIFITARIRRIGEGNSFSLFVLPPPGGIYPVQEVPQGTYPLAKVGASWPGQDGVGWYTKVGNLPSQGRYPQSRYVPPVPR